MKNTITIHTGRMKDKRERTFIFSTEEAGVLPFFSERRSINEWTFPRYITGEVEEMDGTTNVISTWKDFDSFGELQGQNIFSVEINGKDLNAPIVEAAEKAGATVKFPLLYHVQFFFEDKPEWVFNWYPTTGTLSKQKTTDKFYRMAQLGKHDTVEEALKACQ